MELTPLILIILLHWLSDFFLQNDQMAQNKSTSNKWLSIHIAVYMVPFMVFFGWKYALLNGALHWITDWCSSRGAKYFWEKGDVHNFFVVVGADQAVHYLCLILTYVWLFNV